MMEAQKSNKQEERAQNISTTPSTNRQSESLREGIDRVKKEQGDKVGDKAKATKISKSAVSTKGSQ
jgi:hypothetical protein